MRHAVRVNGLTGLAINKLDTLSGLGDLKVCTAYKLPDGTIIKDFPATLEELANCEPVYETLKGFDDDITGCQSFDETSSAVQRLHRAAGGAVQCPVKMVGVGPSRAQNLER